MNNLCETKHKNLSVGCVLSKENTKQESIASYKYIYWQVFSSLSFYLRNKWKKKFKKTNIE